MGKKNIQPTTSSPVSRTLVVAPRPALEELRAEPQEGHISSLTGPDPSYEALYQTEDQRDPKAWGCYIEQWEPSAHQEWIEFMMDIGMGINWYTSYDGDDE